MRNYIKVGYTGDKLILSPVAAEMLSRFVPKGCPFKDYTLLDLLKDTFGKYSWRFTSDISVADFIKEIAKFDPYMRVYGDDIILIVGG